MNILWIQVGIGHDYVWLSLGQNFVRNKEIKKEIVGKKEFIFF
jgi:hypothetical protein